MKFPPLVPAFALGLGLVQSAGCVVTVDSHSEIAREEKRFSVDGTADVRVATFDGSIQVRSWDKPDVLVEIEKRGPSKAAVESLQVIVEQKGNVIDLEVKRPRNETFSGIRFRQAAYASLVVTVPRTTNIRARTGDGSIKIERVTGHIELRTGDGSIRASEVAGDLSFDTGDGSVVVERAEGQLTVDTGDGSVNVSGSLGAVKLHTGDGSVIYRADAGSAMTDQWDITTGDGSVTLYLPTDLGVDLDAHTGDGRIINDLGIEKSDGDDRTRRTLRGRIGSGGKLLRVRTGDGAIRLRVN
jgi:DUF4097 and DUF4098 domain-containing protein YvlB